MSNTVLLQTNPIRVHSQIFTSTGTRVLGNITNSRQISEKRLLPLIPSSWSPFAFHPHRPSISETVIALPSSIPPRLPSQTCSLPPASVLCMLVDRLSWRSGVILLRWWLIFSMALTLSLMLIRSPLSFTTCHRRRILTASSIFSRTSLEADGLMKM
jgi:hypothetical protein